MTKDWSPTRLCSPCWRPRSGFACGSGNVDCDVIRKLRERRIEPYGLIKCIALADIPKRLSICSSQKVTIFQGHSFGRRWRLFTGGGGWASSAHLCMSQQKIIDCRLLTLALLLLIPQWLEIKSALHVSITAIIYIIGRKLALQSVCKLTKPNVSMKIVSECYKAITEFSCQKPSRRKSTCQPPLQRSTRTHESQILDYCKNSWSHSIQKWIRVVAVSNFINDLPFCANCFPI